MGRFATLVLLALSACACDELRARGLDTADASASDTAPADSFVPDTTASDAALEPDLVDEAPEWPVELLDASVWTDAQIADAVAECEAWHAAQPAPPEPDVVLDCASGDCRLDLPLEPVREARVEVVLEVTWDGAPMPGSFVARVVLVDPRLGRQAFLSREDGHFVDSSVPAGTWDVYLVTGLDDDEDGVQDLPLGRLRLARDVVLEADTTLSYDAGPDDAVLLQGSVRFDGAAPAEDEPWVLQLALEGGVPELGSFSGPKTFGLAPRGPSFAVPVFPDTWRVAAARELVTDRTSCAEPPCAPDRTAPPGLALVEPALHVESDTALDIELATARLSGVLRTDGTRLRTAVRLESAQARPEARAELGARLDLTGEATPYELRLWRGVYDLYGGHPERLLARDVRLEGDRTLDLVLDEVRLEGFVSLPSGPLPYARLHVLGAPLSEPLELALHDGRLDLALPRGTYDLFASWGPQPDGLAEGTQRLARRLVLDADTRLEHALRPVPVRVELDLPHAEAILLEAPWHGREHSLDLPDDARTLPLRFAGHVLPGVYDLVVASGANYGGVHGTVAVARCQPVTGVETLQRELPRRELVLRAVDPVGIGLSEVEFIIEPASSPAQLPGTRDRDADYLATRGFADHALARLTPGTWRITATFGEVSATRIVEVR